MAMPPLIALIGARTQNAIRMCAISHVGVSSSLEQHHIRSEIDVRSSNEAWYMQSLHSGKHENPWRSRTPTD